MHLRYSTTEGIELKTLRFRAWLWAIRKCIIASFAKQFLSKKGCDAMNDLQAKFSHSCASHANLILRVLHTSLAKFQKSKKSELNSHVKLQKCNRKILMKLLCYEQNSRIASIQVELIILFIKWRSFRLNIARVEPKMWSTQLRNLKGCHVLIRNFRVLKTSIFCCAKNFASGGAPPSFTKF